MTRAGRLTAMLLAAAGCCASVGTLAAPPASAGPVAGPVARVGEPSHVYEWWYDKLRLAQAHRTTTGRGVTVAVIDSDLDSRIPDLRGADITFGHTCPAGYERKAKPLTGRTADHGTAMTTLIVGNGHGSPGGRGILGVAPGAHLLFYPNDADGKYSEYVDCDELEMGKQIVDAARRGADIINLSFNCGDTIEPYVRKAMAMGAVVVAAAGNRHDYIHGWIRDPAAMPGVVAVMAVDEQAKPWVDNPVPIMIDGKFHANAPVISAPGVKVQNTGYYPDRGEWRSDGTRTGTSDATAIVSGMLALVKAKYPRATGNQLIQQLIHHGHASRYAWDPAYGFGIASVTEMLASDPTGWPDENPLLKGPHAAVRNYPMSTYDRSRPTASASPGVAASGASTPAASASASPSSAAAAPSEGGSGGTSGGGLPGWSWLAGLAVLLAAAATLVARSAGRRAHAPGRSQP